MRPGERASLTLAESASDVANDVHRSSEVLTFHQHRLPTQAEEEKDFSSSPIRRAPLFCLVPCNTELQDGSRGFLRGTART